MKNLENDRLILGALENCDLPALGIINLQMRIDTGAKTSSLHVDQIKKVNRSGVTWITFDLHPDIYNTDTTVKCEAPLHDIRRVKSSNGVSEERYVIETDLCIAEHTWPIEITLTDRSEMSNLMLLGRQGMGKRVYVDPSKNFLASK